MKSPISIPKNETKVSDIFELLCRIEVTREYNTLYFINKLPNAISGEEMEEVIHIKEGETYDLSKYDYIKDVSGGKSVQQLYFEIL